MKKIKKLKPLIQNAYVNKSSVHGCGGFAKKAIQKGCMIEGCPYVESAADPPPPPPQEIVKYLFAGQKKNTTGIILGYGAVYNNAKHSNAEYFFDDEKNVISFMAKRKIREGEEIFVNYGKKYRASRKKKPK